MTNIKKQLGGEKKKKTQAIIATKLEKGKPLED